jgi:flagellar basal body-associated protein FliL
MEKTSQEIIQNQQITEKKLMRWIWIIIIGAILAVVIFFVFYFSLVKIEKKDSISNNQTQSSLTLKDCRDASETVKDQNLGLKNTVISECYLKLAISENDPKICEELGDKLDKIYQDNCKALVTGNIDYCKEIAKEKPSWADDCYNSVAHYFNNSEACDFIINDDSEKKRCYYDLGIILKDPEVCNKIDSESLRSGCLEKTI